MAITKDEMRSLTRRLGLIEGLLPVLQRLTEPLLAEGVIEAAPSQDVALTRESLALLKATMQSLRARGTAATVAKELTRSQVASSYFQSQQIAALLGQINRKTTALLADAIEGAAIPQAMKDTWEAGLDADLADLDNLLRDLSDER